ncbi:unnamed protein product [Prunus armeniaca]|uniref:Disease resistance protein At4g27190-like leucine-rich repeats domain-containing protein n=1 Tax=Prunus armeniaca TaxID=36596 RepID=A0A6J5Y5M2_PRUAR|nr:unnamed protein product [Prunus armeniaca]
MDSPQSQGFQNLTSLYVSDCNNLRNLLSPSITRGLENPKNLSISKCLKIEEIVTTEVVETEDNGMLPQLSCLELSELPTAKEVKKVSVARGRIFGRSSMTVGKKAGLHF